MAIIGYIRVSSNKQTVEHQRHEIRLYANEHNLTIDTWIEETISSRQPLQKRKLGQLLGTLQEKDVLITSEISRLGRSLLEVMRILEVCLNNGCQVITIKENYHLGNDIQSKVLAFAFGLSAEIERNLISQRTKTSLADIKSQGKKLGRPFSAQSKKLKLAKNTKIVKSLLQRGFSKNQISQLMGVQNTTLRRFLARMGWETYVR